MGDGKFPETRGRNSCTQVYYTWRMNRAAEGVGPSLFRLDIAGAD